MPEISRCGRVSRKQRTLGKKTTNKRQVTLLLCQHPRSDVYSLLLNLEDKRSPFSGGNCFPSHPINFRARKARLAGSVGLHCRIFAQIWFRVPIFSSFSLWCLWIWSSLSRMIKSLGRYHSLSVNLDSLDSAFPDIASRFLNLLSGEK